MMLATYIAICGIKMFSSGSSF